MVIETERRQGRPIVLVLVRKASIHCAPLALTAAAETAALCLTSPTCAQDASSRCRRIDGRGDATANGTPADSTAAATRRPAVRRAARAISFHHCGSARGGGAAVRAPCVVHASCAPRLRRPRRPHPCRHHRRRRCHRHGRRPRHAALATPLSLPPRCPRRRRLSDPCRRRQPSCRTCRRSRCTA